MAVHIVRKLTNLPPVLSVEDTSKLLGISRSAGYRAVAAGHIPTVRVGRRLFVPTPRLLSLLGAVTEQRGSDKRVVSMAKSWSPLVAN